MRKMIRYIEVISIVGINVFIIVVFVRVFIYFRFLE